MQQHDDIRIGTLIHAENAASTIRQIAPHGFESFQITFGEQIGGIDVAQLARDVREALDATGNTAVISAIGIYGNPLINDATASGWRPLIEAARDFGCDVVGGFTGRLPDEPIAASLPRFSEVFTPLAQAAEDHGVRIAFENCAMGGNWQRGDWNIAHSPAAWQRMFDAVPSDALGLEWEPCHQLVQLIDPLPQLREWLPKVFHVHGKDASVLWDVVHKSGIGGPDEFAYHRTPGFGDTNWTDLISMLRIGGFGGAIDIEGWHDPVYCGDMEMTGQVHALNYLRQCRGGDFVPNPSE